MSRQTKLVGFIGVLVLLCISALCLLFDDARAPGRNAWLGVGVLVLLGVLLILATPQAIFRLTLTSDEMIVHSPFGLRHYRRAELVDFRKDFDLESNGAPVALRLSFRGRRPVCIVECAFDCERDEILNAIDRWIGVDVSTPRKDQK